MDFFHQPNLPNPTPKLKSSELLKLGGAILLFGILLIFISKWIDHIQENQRPVSFTEPEIREEPLPYLVIMVENEYYCHGIMISYHNNYGLLTAAHCNVDDTVQYYFIDSSPEMDLPEKIKHSVEQNVRHRSLDLRLITFKPLEEEKERFLPLGSESIAKNVTDSGILISGFHCQEDSYTSQQLNYSITFEPRRIQDHLTSLEPFCLGISGSPVIHPDNGLLMAMYIGILDDSEGIFIDLTSERYWIGNLLF